MKRVALVLVVLLLGSLLVGVASAEGIVNAYVTCNQLSVRMSPDSNASKYTSLKNGDTLYVLGETSNNKGEHFYMIQLSSIGQDFSDYDETGNWRYGYVMSDFVTVAEKQYIVLERDTVLWAAPGSSVGVRERSKGTQLLLLDQYVDSYGQLWYVVQAQDNAGGSGFIKAGNSYSQYGQNNQTVGANVTTGGNALVNCHTLAVRSVMNDEADPIGYLHNGDVVHVVYAGEYFTGIEYAYKNTVVVGYVHTKHLVGIWQ